MRNVFISLAAVALTGCASAPVMRASANPYATEAFNNAIEDIIGSVYGHGEPQPDAVCPGISYAPPARYHHPIADVIPNPECVQRTPYRNESTFGGHAPQRGKNMKPVIG